MSEKVIYYFFTIFILLGIAWVFNSWIAYLMWFVGSIILAMVWDDMWDDGGTT